MHLAALLTLMSLVVAATEPSARLPVPPKPGDRAMRSAPANDLCDNREIVCTSGEARQIATDNTGALTDGPNTVGTACSAAGPNGIQADVWYALTAPCAGSMTVSMCGVPSYDAMLAVYTNGTASCSCPPNNTQDIACNDDACGIASTSEVTGTIAAGNCYLIRVAGFSSIGTPGDASQGISEIDISFTCSSGTVPLPQSAGACLTDDDCITEARCISCVCYEPRNRYVAFQPNNVASVAFRVTSPVCPALSKWVGTPNGSGFATLTASAVTRVWSEPVIYAGSADIVPGARYVIEATTDEIAFSAPLTLPTVQHWGDAAGTFLSGWRAPDRRVNFQDIYASILKFFGVAFPAAPHVSWVDIDPATVNNLINIADVFGIVNAFGGLGYPFALTCACTTNADCNDGRFCTGVESCSSGLCIPGPSPCATGQLCNEATDSCGPCTGAIDCDDGLFCTGTELCTGGLCQVGSYPCGAMGCNETTDSCSALLDAPPGIRLQAISSTASFSLTPAGIEVIAAGIVMEVTLEVLARGWDSTGNADRKLAVVQAAVDPAGYLGSNAVPPSAGINLTPKGYPATPYQGAFQRTCTGGVNIGQGCTNNGHCPGSTCAALAPRFALSTCSPIVANRTSSLAYAFGASAVSPGCGAVDPGPVPDPITYGYVGTLVLQIPATARGEYTVGFNPDIKESFLLQVDGTRMPGTLLTSAVIRVIRIIYVDAAATGTNDGTSWTNAFTRLQDGLLSAVSGDQVWAANGTYYPDRGAGITLGDRTKSFQLISGVAMYGGFAGFETQLSQRNPAVNVTILSGDLNGDDGPAAFQDNGENSYHVVTGSGTGATAILDGFTITAGNANGGGAGEAQGGGMYINNGDPTVRSCRFEANSADSAGAVKIESTSDPRFDDCTFSGNRSTATAGAMFIAGGNPVLTFCTFIGNAALGGGGAIVRTGGSPVLIGCRFLGNHAIGGVGGALAHEFTGTVTMTSCLFSGNTAVSNGGAIYTDFTSSVLTATNCTFFQNSSSANGGGILAANGTTTIRNSVFWNNSDSGGMDESAQIHIGSGTVTVDYSDVQGGWTGTGANNLNIDPLFVDGNGADNVIGTDDDDLRLRPGSLCIDAANTPLLPTDSLDLDGDGNIAERSSLDVLRNPRILDDPATTDTGVPGSNVVDMGAAEFFTDCNGDGVPDICNLDCGAAQGPCDLAGCGGSADCDDNNRLDECDIAGCDVANPDYPGCDDCNLNGVRDDCDISGATSLDVLPMGMPDGVPDECTITDQGGTNNWSNALIWTNNTVPNNGQNTFNVTIRPVDVARIPSGFAASKVNLDIPATINSLRILGAGSELNVTGAVNENLTVAAAGGILIRGDLASSGMSSSLLVNNDRLIDASAGALTVGAAGVYAASTPVTVTSTCVTAGSVRIDQGICACGVQDEIDGGGMFLTSDMQANILGDLVLAGSGACLPCPTNLRGGITPPPKLCVTGGAGGSGRPGLPGSRMVDCTGNTDDLTIGGSLIMQNTHAHVQIGGAGCALAGRGDDPGAPGVAEAAAGSRSAMQGGSTGIRLGGDVVIEGAGNLVDWVNAKLTFDGAAPQFFEVAGGDVGANPSGFAANFALGEIELLAGRNVTLIDQFDNDLVESGPEALYVNTVTLGAGSRLTIRNCGAVEKVDVFRSCSSSDSRAAGVFRRSACEERRRDAACTSPRGSR